MSDRSLLVSEIFGPTVQGEGPSSGRLCSFIRLGLCNLHCSWCDTPYTWDWTRFDRATELHRMTVTDIVGAVTAMGPRFVVITGGEPLVHRDALVDLVDVLHSGGFEIEIETNGTLPPGDLASKVCFNVSPKLSHSGDPRHLRLTEHLHDYVHGETCFKFVVTCPADLDEISEIRDVFDISDDQIWVMPEGRTVFAIAHGLAGLADDVIKRGWNLTGRLHVTVWGDKRGH